MLRERKRIYVRVAHAEEKLAAEEKGLRIPMMMMTTRTYLRRVTVIKVILKAPAVAVAPVVLAMILVVTDPATAAARVEVVVPAKAHQAQEYP